MVKMAWYEKEEVTSGWFGKNNSARWLRKFEYFNTEGDAKNYLENFLIGTGKQVSMVFITEEKSVNNDLY